MKRLLLLLTCMISSCFASDNEHIQLSPACKKLLTTLNNYGEWARYHHTEHGCAHISDYIKDVKTSLKTPFMQQALKLSNPTTSPFDTYTPEETFPQMILPILTRSITNEILTTPVQSVLQSLQKTTTDLLCIEKMAQDAQICIKTMAQDAQKQPLIDKKNFLNPLIVNIFQEQSSDFQPLLFMTAIAAGGFLVAYSASTNKNWENLKIGLPLFGMLLWNHRNAFSKLLSSKNDPYAHLDNKEIAELRTIKRNLSSRFDEHLNGTYSQKDFVERIADIEGGIKEKERKSRITKIEERIKEEERIKKEERNSRIKIMAPTDKKIVEKRGEQEEKACTEKFRKRSGLYYRILYPTNIPDSSSFDSTVQMNQLAEALFKKQKEKKQKETTALLGSLIRESEAIRKQLTGLHNMLAASDIGLLALHSTE